MKALSSPTLQFIHIAMSPPNIIAATIASKAAPNAPKRKRDEEGFDAVAVEFYLCILFISPFDKNDDEWWKHAYKNVMDPMKCIMKPFYNTQIPKE